MIVCKYDTTKECDGIMKNCIKCSMVVELEKIKTEISKIDKIYYPDLSFSETGDCYIQRKSVADIIDKYISELKGE